MERHAFDFALLSSLSLRLLGIGPRSAAVEVGDDHLEVTFGPWRLATALSNVEDAEVTGPYNPFKAYGVRVSLADLGVTFGTTTARGLCIRFREPVAAAFPGGLVRHPSLTVTVADPEALRRVLLRQGHAPRPLLAAVEADVVPERPVVEPEEDRRARERAVRSARRAARQRAENRVQERRRAEQAAAKKVAAKRTTAKKPTATTTAKKPAGAPKKRTARTPAARTDAASTT